MFRYEAPRIVNSPPLFFVAVCVSLQSDGLKSGSAQAQQQQQQHLDVSGVACVAAARAAECAFDCGRVSHAACVFVG